MKKKKQPQPKPLKVGKATLTPIAGQKFPWIGALIVAGLTFLIYFTALKNGFVGSWDDNAYIYDNQEIRSLDYRFLKWSLCAIVVSLWHPLTLFSFALDYAIWGLNPLGYHLTNNLFHAFNTSLVFILTVRLINLGGEGIRQSKMALISGTITAFLFGLHPLHVESVAWVSERKDVLSAFFFLLSLLAYLEYLYAANLRKSSLFYVACLLSYILALMSKPMAVSLPIVLLILDFYPLRRLTLKGSVKNVIIEKWPFLLLSLLSSFITMWAHHSRGWLTTTEQVSVYIRILVSVRGYIFYILKMILPLNLAPLYPLPPKINPTDIEYLGSAILLVSITFWCIRSVNRNKLYLSIWMYYVVTLLPVIGIVQVGSQMAADRYTYLPSLGPFLLAGFGVAYLYERDLKRQYKTLITVILVFLAVVMSSKTIAQIAIWKDPITLWSYEISLYPNTAYAAYGNRGLAYYNMGDHERAIKDFDKAIAIRPQGPVVYINRGLAYDSLGNDQQAIKDYNKAIELDPKNIASYINRGALYTDLGEYQLAVNDYTRVIELMPQNADAYCNRGIVYNGLGNYQVAIKDFDKALELNHGYASCYTHRGNAYLNLGNHKQAIVNYNEAITLDPKDPNAYYNLALIYSQLGDAEHATINYKKAAALGDKEAQDYLRSQGVD